MDITWFSKSPIDRKTIINWSPIWHNKTLGTAQNCCQLVKNCGMYDNYALGSPLLRIWLQFQSIYRKNCISTKHFQYTFASDFIWCTRTYLVHLWKLECFLSVPWIHFYKTKDNIDSYRQGVSEHQSGQSGADRITLSHGVNSGEENNNVRQRFQVQSNPSKFVHRKQHLYSHVTAYCILWCMFLSVWRYACSHARSSSEVVFAQNESIFY